MPYLYPVDLLLYYCSYPVSSFLNFMASLWICRRLFCVWQTECVEKLTPQKQLSTNSHELIHKYASYLSLSVDNSPGCVLHSFPKSLHRLSGDHPYDNWHNSSLIGCLSIPNLIAHYHTFQIIS